MNHEKLCDIYINLGKEQMCKTCRTYPRHVEVYGSLHEVSLSLSCPAAAELILGKTGPDRYVTKYKPVVENPGKYKVCGAEEKLLSELEKVRDVMFAITGDRKISLEQRMAMVLTLSHDAQGRLNKEVSTADILDRYTREGAADRYAARLSQLFKTEYSERGNLGQLKKRQDLMCVYLEFCGKLEPILGDWGKRMEQTAMQLYGPKANTTQYDLWCREMEARYPFYSVYMEHLMNYFLYVYLYGAVYDGDLYTKVKLAVVSCLVIREMNIAVYAKTGDFTNQDAVRSAYFYSRELEHSDKNIEMLEERLSGAFSPSLSELLTCI